MTVGALALGSASCTLSLDTKTVQCAVDAECASFGEEYANYKCIASFCHADCTEKADCESESPRHECQAGVCVDPTWGCIGQPVNTEGGGDVTFRVPIRNLLTMETPTNLSVSVCLRPDPDCMSPISTDFNVMEDGLVDVSIPNVPDGGFDGFLFLTADALLPSYYHFINPISESNEDEPAPELLMFAPATVDILSATAGVEVDPNLGVIIFRTHDCTGAPAAGISAAPTPEGNSIFFSVDSTNLPDPNVSVTDAAGIGGLANLPVGISRIQLTLEETGEALDDFSLPVKGNSVTMTNFQP